MRLSILTAGIILIAISTAPSMGYAAGQPQTGDFLRRQPGKLATRPRKAKWR